MNNNKNLFYRPLIVLGTLLYPVYALPWIIKSMSKKENMGYILFSLSMAYYAYLMIPYFDFDLTRHYDDFEVMSGTKFSDIFVVDPRIKHYIFNVYLWLIHQIGLPKEFVPFSFTFAKYLFLFMSLKLVTDSYMYNFPQNSSLKKWIVLLSPLLIIGSVQFVRDVSGLRNNLAFAIYIYSILKYYIHNKRMLPYLLFLVASAIHLSIIPLILVFFLSVYIKSQQFWRIVFIVSFIILFLGLADNIFFYVIGSIKPFLASKGLYISYYMDPDGKWGAGYFADKGIATLILEKYFRPSIFYLAGLYLFIEKKLTFDQIKVYLYIAFAFIVFVSVSRTFFDRYTYFYKFIFIYIVTIDFAHKPLNNLRKVFFISLVTMIILTKIISIYRYGAVYIDSWSETLYVPAPIMLLRTTEPNMYILKPYFN